MAHREEPPTTHGHRKGSQGHSVTGVATILSCSLPRPRSGRRCQVPAAVLPPPAPHVTVWFVTVVSCHQRHQRS